MKAMEILQQYWSQIERLLVYVQYCAVNDIRTPVCRDFWHWTVYFCIGLALIIVFIAGKKILKAQLELHRNKKRLEARKIVADAETIEQAKWVGDDSQQSDLSQEELAERMREALRVKSEMEANKAKQGA
jgi:hypothetical protein